ncbi:MAG: hypothetical protein SOR89_05890 [Ndongobacter sp.]|nr:hypothetical protein [Ndongobacter sp.]
MQGRFFLFLIFCAAAILVGVLGWIPFAAVFLLILLGLITLGYSALRTVRRRLEQYSASYLGSSLPEALRKIREEKIERPRSLNGMDRIYLPMLQEDFPDMNVEELRTRASRELQRALQMISAQQLPVMEHSDAIPFDAQIRQRIEDLQRQDSEEHFEDIHVHQSVLSRYTKEPGQRRLVFQTGIEYRHFIEQNGKLRSGNKTEKEQSRYEVTYLHVDDPDLIARLSSESNEAAYMNHCPNCGAPLVLKDGRCSYCHAELHEISLRTWTLYSFREIA